MSDQLTLVDVRDVWDEVRLGLDYTKNKIDAPWRPEDIYAACLSGTAYLYTGETGFVVVQPKTDPFSGAPELFVWVAFARGDKNIERFQESVDALATDHGYSKLTMWTNRQGFERVPGWVQVATVYERLV